MSQNFIHKLEHHKSDFHQRGRQFLSPETVALTCQNNHLLIRTNYKLQLEGCTLSGQDLCITEEEEEEGGGDPDHDVSSSSPSVVLKR